LHNAKASTPLLYTYLFNLAPLPLSGFETVKLLLAGYTDEFVGIRTHVKAHDEARVDARIEARVKAVEDYVIDSLPLPALRPAPYQSNSTLQEMLLPNKLVWIGVLLGNS
jgi:hypothetical protein